MNIGVIGLGYVGIQLALALGQRYKTIGFDLDPSKIDDYQLGIDKTGEVSAEQFSAAHNLVFSSESENLAGCDIYIVAVPTPVDDSTRPDFKPLLKASETVGHVMASGATVIYESTVYPGATEEICIPVLERVSDVNLDIMVS